MQGLDTQYLYCNNKRTKIHRLGFVCQNWTIRFFKPDYLISIDLTLGYESDRFSQGNLEILQGIDLGHEWRHCTKGISNPSMGQRDRRWGENTLRRRKPVEESETLVLGELNSPKNSKIPWRNQGITNGGLEVTLMVVLERMRVKSERIGEGVSSVQGVKPVKAE
jgi:hypothetical protein